MGMVKDHVINIYSLHSSGT